MSGVVKYYNGFPIEFDWLNGQLMANATAMCAAFGKRPNDWTNSAGAVRYINALQAKPEIPVLVETRHGGTNPGTWINERLILKLAQWLDVHFEIQCDEWVAELLRTGSVALARPLPQTRAEALRELAESLDREEALALQLAEAQPAVEFHKQVTESEDTMPVAEAAKLLGVGPIKLFIFLREQRIFMNGTGGQHRNMPYQQYLDAKYFGIVEHPFKTPDGKTHINVKPVVTQKGLDYIRKRLPDSL